MRTVPKALIEMRKNQKAETIVIINNAIKELNDEGFKITVKNLVERTGLSRSLFSKPHIKGLLPKPELTKIINVDVLNTNDIFKLKEKLQKSLFLNEEKDIKILRLKNELYEKRDECELLRGKLHIIMQKCRIKGFEITD